MGKSGCWSLLLALTLAACDNHKSVSLAQILPAWEDLCMVGGPTESNARLAGTSLATNVPFNEQDIKLSRQLIENTNAAQNSSSGEGNTTAFYVNSLEGWWFGRNNDASIRYYSGQLALSRSGTPTIGETQWCSISGNLSDFSQLSDALLSLSQKGFVLSPATNGHALAGDGLMRLIGRVGSTAVVVEIMNSDKFHDRKRYLLGQNYSRLIRMNLKTPDLVEYPPTMDQLKSRFSGEIHYSFIAGAQNK